MKTVFLCFYFETSQLDTVVSRKKLLGKLVPASLEKQLERYPKLSQVLLPASVAGLEKTDVTVYQLLQVSFIQKHNTVS